MDNVPKIFRSSLLYDEDPNNLSLTNFPDFSAAFRQVPIRKQDFRWLLMKAEHPLMGENFFFVEKCCPFGVISQ